MGLLETDTAPEMSYLNDQVRFPFCKGCGHSSVLRRLNEALVTLQPDPHNVALVTDIGCIGLADGLFKDLHTVHTTHGRSTAFATGIALADSVLEQGNLKTIVLIGDGGAMIGLQHLVHAAMLNVDLTVIICNNLVYGMTGGQGSGLTPECFITATTPKGNIVPPVDLCEILRHSKAPWVARTLATSREFPALLKEALAFPGFAVLEVLELCTEFAVPENDLTGKKLEEIAEANRWHIGLIERNEHRETYVRRYLKSIRMETDGTSKPAHQGGEQILSLRRPLNIILAGSAGERIQSSAAFLCQAALDSGLYATQKNDNPVTQGSGFSLSELCLSPFPIAFTGIEEPTIVLITSEDGLRELKAQGWLKRLNEDSAVYLDESISADVPGNRFPFRKVFGPKAAALGALCFLAATYTKAEGERIVQRVEKRFGPASAEIIRKGLNALSITDRTR